MDSFGFDFPGGDLLDLGSLGSWTNNTPMGNSPNGGSGGLPFSVGTPTGVQSLGDDPFANMPGGGADDFGFGESPKPSPGATTSSAGSAARKPTDGAAPAVSAADGGSSANSYFGSELEGSKIKADTSSSGGDIKKQTETDAKKTNSNSSTTTTSSAAPSSSASTSGPSSSPTALKTETTSVSCGAGSTAAASASTSMPASKSELTQAFSSSAPGASTARPSSSGMATTGSSGAMTSTGTSAAPSASTTSTVRPHIGNQQQHPQQQHNQQQSMQHAQQQRYSGQMMMTQQQPNGQQQPGFVGQPYQQMRMQQQMAGVSGGQPTSAAGQYMNAQGQAYRPPTSAFDEELARVQAMMLQHPDVIPPPSEVLRISMSQSAASQQQQGITMGANAAYMQQRAGQAMPRGGAGNAAYAQYGAPNPNMMMGGPQQQAQQAGMVNARLRAAQMAHQQAQRGGASRTPGGGNLADTQTAWQSENDLPLRRKMIGKIVSLLQQRKPDAPTEWMRRLPDMARRLEDSLYRTAKNRDEYGDFSSLKTRLQHLAVTMGARAQHKAGGNPRGGAGVIPGAGGGAAGSVGMMSGASNVPPGMAMNPATGAMGPQGHVVGNMPYGNRMTQQQLMQQQHLQMQMQNPQMRQQFTPQQLQQFQEAQLQRRQFQMQQAQQQAQMQRQNSLQQQQQQQQYQQNQALQRQNSMRQQQMQQQQQQQQPGQQPGGSAAMQQQMNQRQNPNYMQQQQQAQAQAQRRSVSNVSANAAGAGGQPRMSSEMSLGESSDFLNLDLSQSLLGSGDLPGDSSSGLNGGADAMKSGGDNDGNVTGVKRTLSQSQQQMAAAANAAAFKRTKMGGAAPGNQNNANATQRPPGNAPAGAPQGAQQPGMQKPVTSTSGSSKTPPMSTVNAK